jgi:hypothetical protein
MEGIAASLPERRNARDQQKNMRRNAMRCSRSRSLRVAAAALVLVAFVALPASAQTVAEPFNTDYTAVSLGSVPGLPTNYGGLTFRRNDPNTILIGGGANGGGGAIYAISVVRNSENHITGFTGTASVYTEGAYNDGGITYGPDNVLFLARWPVNELGQVKLGSTTTDKVVPMGPLGVVSSLSALAFVPAGFPGAGSLKLVTYSSGHWYDAAVVADGNGTFDVTNVVLETQILGGPEGFVYVPPGSPQFTDFSSLLVAEYSGGRISAYQVDENGDPILETRVAFITGLTGAEGAVVDPLTGDFLFSTFGGSNQVVAVRGFATPVSCEGCVSTAGCTDTCDNNTNACRTCGHPIRNDRCVVNAVAVLQGALALRDCELCTCDVNDSSTVTVTDALQILRSCTGAPVSLNCSDPAAASD